ncbi:MAG: hypothetical protein QGI05_01120 [Candidatus Omnitrophota bacterium]|nr:hypothetical protein [Candidatus Omnitrophota bacterium]
MSAELKKMAKCKSCDADFATIKQLEYIKKKINIPEDILNLCPKCRRKKTIKEISAIKK